MDILNFDKKDIKTSYCIDLDTRDRQVLVSSARAYPRLQASPDREGRIAVVCYGPSLEETWPQVRDFEHIITCSGAHKYLIDHGVIPTWHCEVDPRPHKADLIGQPHKDVEYLIASVCHQDVFDLLEGYRIKLWHVFSNESQRKIPITHARGEWAITGGSNVGMRALVLARFLGFKKLSIFGMDYSFRRDGSQHTGWHPKENPNIYAVEVDGEHFFTNPPMHKYAIEFFDEIARIGNIEVEVVGHGLLQAQIKAHMKHSPLIPPNQPPAMIAATSPIVITPEYSALNRQLHESNPAYGVSGSKRAEIVRKLVETTKAQSVLDYGCGKGTLALALPFPIWEYDPCIPGKETPPRPADLVICTDVLEHVEPECLASVLMDIARCVIKVGYVVINTGPSRKVLADGRNTHLIQKPLNWWKATLEQYFGIAKIEMQGAEVVAVLSRKPKAEKQPAKPAPALDISRRITPVRHDKTEVQFHTPNEQTQWRAQSLIVKEPATIAWIDTFKPGEVFYDVGANVGGYTVWAAKRRGVKVIAFEPESGNYAMLCRNMTLNGVNGAAYCVALSDEAKVSSIYLSSQDVGGSCNSFDAEIGPDMAKRKGIAQGCVGYRLDDFANALPAPDHIKIDVDGLEPKVIAGAKKLLESGSVKSLLLEVNTNLPEHRAMVEYLTGIGFAFDQAQVDKAIRKEGNFKGCAEYVFTRQPLILDFNRLNSAHAPFQHVYAENVFSSEFYAEIQKNMPTEWTEIAKSRNVQGYPERFTASPDTPFWRHLFARMRDGALKRHLCSMFGVPDADSLTDECLLIRDKPGYKIGPHTDSPQKVITALFYLPKDDSATGAGTSIYTPKEPGFRCKGGPHYEFEQFNRVATMPFKPNSVFAFLKTDNSFHGVEPCDVTRDVLLYDIRRPK